MPDDDIQLGAAAAVDVVVAPGTDHGVAVHQPGTAADRIGGDREVIDEACFGRIGVRIRQPGDRQAAARALEFSAHGALRGADGLVVIGIAPLHHVVVLGAHDREAVEIASACERDDVGDVVGCELRRELDHDPSGSELQIHGVLRVEPPPVGGAGGGENLGAGARLGGRLGRGGRSGERGGEEQQHGGRQSQCRCAGNGAHWSRSSQ